MNRKERELLANLHEQLGTLPSRLRKATPAQIGEENEKYREIIVHTRRVLLGALGDADMLDDAQYDLDDLGETISSMGEIGGDE